MRARHRSRPDLPHAPLQIVHPVAIPRAAILGAEMMEELPSLEAAALYSLFRAALVWSSAPEGAVPELAAVERDALGRMAEGGCWAAVAVIAGQLAGSTATKPEKLAQSCLCIADAALSHSARRTALAFTLLAALVLPRNPRFAWAAGRMLREHGKMREAEAWFRRALRMAVWSDDAHAHGLSLSSLGVLAQLTGNNAKAEQRLLEALTVASRNGLRQLEGEILHNLLVLETDCGHFDRAEEYAARTLQSYLPHHERIPALVHDVACLWMDQGNFERALPMLEAVIPHLAGSPEQFQTFAAAARAAGGIGDEAAFDRAWAGAHEWARELPESHMRAGAWLDLGRGASSLGKWDEASAGPSKWRGCVPRLTRCSRPTRRSTRCAGRNEPMCGRGRRRRGNATPSPGRLSVRYGRFRPPDRDQWPEPRPLPPRAVVSVVVVAPSNRAVVVVRFGEVGVCAHAATRAAAARTSASLAFMEAILLG
jgi:tetratricopeptide (TPR) repeat protein